MGLKILRKRLEVLVKIHKEHPEIRKDLVPFIRDYKQMYELISKRPYKVTRRNYG